MNDEATKYFFYHYDKKIIDIDEEDIEASDDKKWYLDYREV